MRGKNWLAVLVRVVCLVILMVACVAEVYGSSTGIQSQTQIGRASCRERVCLYV